MAAAMTLTNKSSLPNPSKHSSPIINQIDSFSPTSSSTTLSPDSSNSISSPDRSIQLHEQHHHVPPVRLVDYFIVCGLDKYSDIAPISDINGKEKRQTFSLSLYIYIY